MRRAAHEHGGAGQRVGDLLGPGEALGDERAARGERPQHAKQQAVDVLVRDGRPDAHRLVRVVAACLRTEVDRARVAGVLVDRREAGVAQRAEALFQRMHLGVELGQRLGDRQRLAAGTGRVHDQPRRPRVERGPIDAGRVRGRCFERAGQVAEKAVSARAQPRQRVGLRVAGNDHGLAGVPGAEQRRSELERVLAVQGPARPRRHGQGRAPGGDALHEARAMHGLAGTPRDHARRGVGPREVGHQSRERTPARPLTRVHRALQGPQNAPARGGAPATRRPAARPSRRRR